MKGKTWLFWGGLIAAAGGVLFQTSYDVQDLEEKLAGLNRKIVTEQESIQVLKAEWSYLNDPTKLEELATNLLALQPTEARQFLALDVIPMRPAPAPDAVPAPAPGRGLTPLPPMAAMAPQIASARVPSPKAPMETALEKAPVIVPAALPVPAPAKAAPIKPSALVPASARAPALPAAAPAPTAAPAPAGRLAPNAPLSAPNRPTDVAARPAPAMTKTVPVKAAQPYVPKPTDSLGLLVARLGANQ